jgi:hypothetical protein
MQYIEIRLLSKVGCWIPDIDGLMFSRLIFFRPFFKPNSGIASFRRVRATKLILKTIQSTMTMQNERQDVVVL